MIVPGSHRPRSPVPQVELSEQQEQPTQHEQESQELEAELAALVSEVEIEKVQVQRAGLEADELMAPASVPVSEEPTQGSTMKPDKEKVPMAE